MRNISIHKKTKQPLPPFLQKYAPKRTSKPMLSDNDDTYLWTMVDLMTILLIFFILFYSQIVKSSTSILDNFEYNAKKKQNTSQKVKKNSNQSHKKVQLRQKAQYAKKNTHYKLKTQVYTYLLNDEMEKEILSLLDDTPTNRLNIQIEHGRILFVLDEAVTFAKGSAKIINNFKKKLNHIAKILKRRTEYRLEIFGYTDSTPINTLQYPSNWELSAARSINVAKAFISQGIEAHRISVRAHGEHTPNYSDGSKSISKRKVEISLINTLDE